MVGFSKKRAEWVLFLPFFALFAFTDDFLLWSWWLGRAFRSSSRITPSFGRFGGGANFGNNSSKIPFDHRGGEGKVIVFELREVFLPRLRQDGTQRFRKIELDIS